MVHGVAASPDFIGTNNVEYRDFPTQLSQDFQ